MKYFETSAAEGTNIDAEFRNLVDYIDECSNLDNDKPMFKSTELAILETETDNLLEATTVVVNVKKDKKCCLLQ